MNEILLEYYAGKPKELIKCEGYLREIIAMIKKDHEDPFKLTRKRDFYNDSPACKKLNDELAKFFNVKEMNIVWSTGMINAFTFPGFSYTHLERKNNYLAGKYSDITIHICIFADDVYQAGLNEQELLAVLLHEIGHNFYYCPITAGFELFYCIMINPFSRISQIVTKFLFMKVLPSVEDFLKKELPFVINVQDAIFDIFTTTSQFLYPLDMAVKVSKLVAGKAMVVMQNPIKGFMDYGNEKAADSMCAKYGYGPEQSSALKKMRNPQDNIGRQIRDSAGVPSSLMVDFANLSLDIIAMMALDPHPSDNQRAQAMLKKLKKDLAKNEYPPKMKKDLEDEIKRMEKACAIASENSTGSKVQVRNTWYKLLNFITKGHTDFREVFSFYFDPKAF